MQETLAAERLSRLWLSENVRPVHIEGMVYEGLDALDELVGFGSLHVLVKCCLIDPARMEKKEPRISHRTIDLDVEATRLFPNAGDGITQFRRNRSFLSFTCVEAGKDGEFHLGALDFSRFILSSAVIAALCEIRTSDYEQHRAHEHTPETQFHHSAP